MSLSVISFTEKGMHLSEKIAESRGMEDANIYTKWSMAKGAAATGWAEYVEEGIGSWAGKQMQEKNALLFIGACGIAVRAIAPYITDKLHDSPVLVMDEKGEYVIPILSGHMGGANEIAMQVASGIGAKPVMTTATDINGRFAVDLFAKRNGLFIMNKAGIARVSAKVLAGEEITMAIESGHIEEKTETPEGIKIVPYPPEQKTDIVITTEELDSDMGIYLKPREYVIGMGCRRGKEADKIEALIQKSMKEAGISVEQIFALASIDRKKDEQGLLLWSRKADIPFLTFTASRLQELEGDFHRSDFVKEQMGVDNVCERAALKACGLAGRILYEKHAEDGMTIAIAKREWRIVFDE